MIQNLNTHSNFFQYNKKNHFFMCFFLIFSLFLFISNETNTKLVNNSSEFNIKNSNQIKNFQKSSNKLIQKSNIGNGLTIEIIADDGASTFEIESSKVVLFHNPSSFNINFQIINNEGKTLNQGIISEDNSFIKSKNDEYISLTVTKKENMNEKLYLTVLNRFSFSDDFYEDSFIGKSPSIILINNNYNDASSEKSYFPIFAKQKSILYLASEATLKYKFDLQNKPDDVTIKLFNDNGTEIQEFKTSYELEKQCCILTWEKSTDSKVDDLFSFKITVAEVVTESQDIYTSFINKLVSSDNPLYSETPYYSPGDYSIEIATTSPVTLQLLNKYEIIIHNPYYFLLKELQSSENQQTFQESLYKLPKNGKLEISINEEALQTLESGTSSVTLYFSIVYVDGLIIQQNHRVYSGSNINFVAASYNTDNYTLQYSNSLCYVISSPNILEFPLFYSNKCNDEYLLTIYSINGEILADFTKGVSKKILTQKTIIISFNDQIKDDEDLLKFAFGFSQTKIQSQVVFYEKYEFNEMELKYDEDFIVPGDYIFTISTVPMHFSLAPKTIFIIHNSIDKLNVEIQNEHDYYDYTTTKSVLFFMKKNIITLSTKNGLEQVNIAIVNAQNSTSNENLPAVVIVNEGFFMTIGTNSDCNYKIDPSINAYYNVIFSSVNFVNYSFFDDSERQTNRLSILDTKSNCLNSFFSLHSANGFSYHSNFNIIAKTVQFVQSEDNDYTSARSYSFGVRKTEIIKNNEIKGQIYTQLIDFSKCSFLKDAENVNEKAKSYKNFPTIDKSYLEAGKNYEIMIAENDNQIIFFPAHSTVVFYNPTLFTAKTDLGNKGELIDILGDTEYVVLQSDNYLYNISNLKSLKGLQTLRFSIIPLASYYCSDLDIIYLNDKITHLSFANFSDSSNNAFCFLFASPYKQFYSYVSELEYSDPPLMIFNTSSPWQVSSGFLLSNFITLRIQGKNKYSEDSYISFDNIPISTQTISDDNKNGLLDYGSVVKANDSSFDNPDFKGKFCDENKEMIFFKLLTNFIDENIETFTDYYTPVIITLLVIFNVIIIALLIFIIIYTVIIKKKVMQNHTQQDTLNLLYSTLNPNISTQNINTQIPYDRKNNEYPELPNNNVYGNQINEQTNVNEENPYANL